MQPRASADEAKLIEAGIPAFSREWTGDDYVRVAEILTSGKVSLPQLSSDEGKSFLKRLTSTENFSLHRNQTLPLGVRMEDTMKVIGGTNQIIKRYAAAAGRGQNVHAEIAQMMAFAIRTAAIAIQLIDEFMLTVPKDDSYEVRLSGLKQMNRGMMQVFTGAEISLSETKFYSPEDLSLLLEAMAEVMPVAKKAFPTDFRLEFRKKLESRQKAFSGEKDTQNLEKLIKELAA